MKCHYCGAEVPENQKFCLWCGSEQSAAPAPVPAAVIVAAEPVSVPEAAEETLPVVAEGEALAEFPQIFLAEPAPAPKLQLPIGRGVGKMVFLGLLTAGIYPTVIWSRIVTELNIAASRHDGLRTMPFFAMVLLAPVTLGIYPLVWMHKFCRRVGKELGRRTIGWSFGPRTFWLWAVLGSLILAGPFVFCHKLMQAMNKINADYNING